LTLNNIVNGAISAVGMYCGFSGDDGPAESAYYAGVTDVAVTGGYIFLLDSGNQRIRRLSGLPPSAAPAIAANGIVNSASYTAGPIATGELISIFGQNLAPTTAAANVVNNKFPTVIGNVKVLISSVEAPLLAVSPMQINVVVPFILGGRDTATVQVFVDSVPSSPVQVPMAPASAGLFTADQSGKGQGAILNQDASVNSMTNPAVRGAAVSIYGTGAGGFNPPLSDGYLDLSLPYGLFSNSASVTIGGENAPVQYAGGAPYLIDGAFQVNAIVPADIAAGAADVIVTINGVPSNTVQIWTR